jgi:hypothetical protein
MYTLICLHAFFEYCFFLIGLHVDVYASRLLIRVQCLAHVADLTMTWSHDGSASHQPIRTDCPRIEVELGRR